MTDYTRAELLWLAREWRDELERLPLSDPRCATFALAAEQAERMAGETVWLPGAAQLH